MSVSEDHIPYLVFALHFGVGNVGIRKLKPDFLVDHKVHRPLCAIYEYGPLYVEPIQSKHINHASENNRQAAMAKQKKRKTKAENRTSVLAHNEKDKEPKHTKHSAIHIKGHQFLMYQQSQTRPNSIRPWMTQYDVVSVPNYQTHTLPAPRNAARWQCTGQTCNVQ